MLRCLMKQYGRVPWAYYIIVNMVHWKYLTGENEEEKERQKEKQTKTGGDGEAEEKAHNASKIGTPEVSEDPLLSLSARHPLPSPPPQWCAGALAGRVPVTSCNSDAWEMMSDVFTLCVKTP